MVISINISRLFPNILVVFLLVIGANSLLIGKRGSKVRDSTTIIKDLQKTLAKQLDMLEPCRVPAEEIGKVFLPKTYKFAQKLLKLQRSFSKASNPDVAYIIFKELYEFVSSHQAETNILEEFYKTKCKDEEYKKLQEQFDGLFKEFLAAKIMESS